MINAIKANHKANYHFRFEKDYYFNSLLLFANFRVFGLLNNSD